MIESKKASIILVLKVLEEFSDENHYLTHQQIIDKLESLYGVEVERKSDERANLPRLNLNSLAPVI